MLRTPKRVAGVKKAAHGRSPRQEREIAAKLGGAVVKGSGSGYDKGDVRVKGVARIEAKCTEKNSFSITREIVTKIEDAAASCGELPFIEIEFMKVGNKPTQKIAIMPIWALEMLKGA